MRVRPDGTISQFKNGHALDVNGSPVEQAAPEAHFPVDKFIFRPWQCSESPKEEKRMDFEYWFASIVFTCELITDRDAFWKAWVAHDHTVTSIHNYDELYVQLVDDLHLDELVTEFAPRLSDKAAGVLKQLGAALHALDQKIEVSSEFTNPEALLSSPEWTRFREGAIRVLELAEAQPYLRGQQTKAILERLAAEDNSRGVGGS